MKKIVLAAFLLFFCINMNAQTRQLSKDDSKCLSLPLLIQLAEADLAAVDESLDENEYILTTGNEDTDVVSYKFIRNNTFIFRRFVTRRRVVYIIDYYTGGIKTKYMGQIESQKLKLKETVIIENGLKRIYTEPGGKWLISISRTTVSPDDKETLEISITPM